MEVKLVYKCLDTGETGSETIIVVDWEKKYVRDLKYTIQEAIHTPVCDQELFHRGQLLCDDLMPLPRTYHRQGETFSVEFPARADIPAMKKHIDILKSHSLMLENGASIWSIIYELEEALGSVTYFFTPWKNATAEAQRHYFAQERGFDAFVSIFRASLLTRTPSEEDQDRKDRLMFGFSRQDNQNFLEWIVELQVTCLSLIWVFCETAPDRKFAIQKGILPLVIDAFLSDPLTTGLGVTTPRHVVQEEALGTVAGLVEYDAKSQLAAARNTALIEKLMTMADLRSDSRDNCSLFSRQVASNALCYCTFNPASIPVLVKLRVDKEGICVLRDLLLENKDVPLTYYWCMCLARLRSSHLVELGKQTNSTIDELITTFVDRHRPSEITHWEVGKSYVWMTMVPLVHLALAGGRLCHENTSESGIGEQDGCIPSEESCNSSLIDHTPAEQKVRHIHDKVHCVKETADLRAENDHAKEMSRGSGSDVEEQLHDLPYSPEVKIIKLEQNSLEKPVTWPGSPATQRLGFFILEHMLSIPENRVLFLSEGLLPYVMHLSWVLQGRKRENMKRTLTGFTNVSIPSLKDLAKSVLAHMHGLDFVISMKV